MPGIEIITEGDLYYERAVKSILAAKKSVEFMVYIWRDDEIGRRFEEALIRKVAEGVRVELVIDAVGSFELPARCLNRLEAAGVSVYMHHRLRILRFGWFRFLIRRNHRKILIIDGRIAFTGGFNLMRQCSLKYYGEGRWLDMMVATKKPEYVRFLMGQFRDACRRARHRKWAARLLTRSGNKVLVAAGNRLVAYSMSRWLKRRLRHARSRIVIAVPYFIPYGFFWRILAKKLKQGVEVEIILSESSDLRWIDEVSFRLARRLMDKGACVYLYRGHAAGSAGARRFSHAKYFKIDDWVGTGSANYDYRSMVLNLDTLLFFRKSEPGLAGYAENLKSCGHLAARAELKSGIRGWLIWPFRWLL